MSFSTTSVILALAPPAQEGKQQQPMWVSFVPLILLVVVFYFALIRPQQRKQKMLGEMLKAIKPGDKVVTNGGIIASVVTVKEKTVMIRSADTKLEVAKGSITEIIERGGGDVSAS